MSETRSQVSHAHIYLKRERERERERERIEQRSKEPTRRDSFAKDVR